MIRHNLTQKKKDGIISMTEEPKTVLVIDDEPNNVEILSLDLEDAGYEVLTAEHGEAGWQQMEALGHTIDAILLDRMMPVMDGMEFIKRLKSVPAYSHIPVIMQTAAAEKKAMEEGIKAGVYYYLTKPYEASTMLSLVRAAIHAYTEYRTLKSELSLYKRKLHMLKESRFEIKTLEEARYLSTFLANFFPDSGRVILGISELLVNAIEHGNLGISYEEKTRLNDSNSWEQAVIDRQKLPEHCDKVVKVHFIRDDTKISISICDEGEGFDWRQYLEFNPQRAMDNHGRGIALSQLVSFDSIEYTGCGNAVTCCVYTAAQDLNEAEGT